MLKGIPDCISPDLMKILMEMGHGDELCFADANCPASSLGPPVVRADGLRATELLEAVLGFFPLDEFVEQNVMVMKPLDNYPGEPKVWETYKKIIKAQDFSGAFKDFSLLERYAFYERASKCYAVVATSEGEAYANLIIKKGVIFK